MSQPRDYSLPHGLKELADFFEQQKQTDQAMEHLDEALRNTCRALMTGLLEKLGRSVDQDLLFTDEEELIRPKIREVACDFLAETCAGLPDEARVFAIEILVRADLAIESKSRMIEILTEEAWLEILRRRHRMGRIREFFPF